MFVKGESYRDVCTDKACLGRLYKAKIIVWPGRTVAQTRQDVLSGGAAFVF